ncbi:unnamed protein product [Rhizopus stolonifer]
MKTLVYENYNKFISATDTIRRMRSNVENMESEISRLNENITTISHQTKSINQTLGPSRTNIQQLSTAQSSLKRLQFILDLPGQLQYYAEKGKYSQAIQYYTKARRVLDHVALFKGIRDECKTIMEDIKQDIWKTVEESAENIKWLILLGEDKSTLRKEYIRIQTRGLEEKQEVQTAQDLVLNYLKPLNDTVRQFQELFLTEDKEQVEKDLIEALDPFIDRFFNLVHQLTQLPEKIPEEGEFEQLEYLNQLKSSASSSFISQINERMIVFDTEWKKQLVYTLFNTARVGLQDRVKKFIDDLSHTDKIAKFIQDTQAWLTSQITHSCLQLKKYLETSLVVQEGLKTVWQEIANILNDIDVNNTQLIFVISRLCYDLADNSIFEVYSTFSHEFYSTGFRAPIHQALLVDVNAVVERFSKVGQALINRQMIQDGYQISCRLQEAYLQRRPKELTEVSPILCKLLDRLGHVESTMRSVFPSSSSVLESSVPDLGRFGMDTMMNNIDKLFAERMDIYRQVEPTPNAVYQGLLIMMLKSLLEVTRMIQMDTVNFQQIQLDVEYIGQRVWPLAGDRKWTTTLLQEVVSSAYSRCKAPQRLNSNELEMILALINK